MGFLMYDELPPELQNRVRSYLVAGDFLSAKQVHDTWMNNKQAASVD